MDDHPALGFLGHGKLQIRAPAVIGISRGCQVLAHRFHRPSSA
jgi:hypothetical protein